jgi:hypothetical protein
MLLKLSDLRAFWQMVWMQYNRRISAGPHNEWVDGWIRQQERVKQALAAAKQQAAPPESTDAGDEWVDGWVKQQQRLREALAAAKLHNMSRSQR